MSKCPYCGVEVDSGAKFCEECGKPIPQGRECPKCHAQVKVGVKFCSKCGYHFSDQITQGAGLSMGDKNVVAGDVVGHQEEYKITGNATIIKNSDETKKLLQCAVCGSSVVIINAKHCRTCGKDVCVHHFDEASGQCTDCVSEQKKYRVKEYQEALNGAFEDGMLETSERRSLEALRKRLNLSKDEADEIEYKVRESFAQRGVQIVDSLNPAEEKSLELASRSLWVEGEATDALERCRELYNRHPLSESVISVYYGALSSVDVESAWKSISNVSMSVKALWLAKYDIAVKQKKDIDANECIDYLLSKWPQCPLVRCRAAVFYKTLGGKQNLAKARGLIKDLRTGADELARAWIFIANGVVGNGFVGVASQNMIDAIKKATPYVGLVLDTVICKDGERPDDVLKRIKHGAPSKARHELVG